MGSAIRRAFFEDSQHSLLNEESSNSNISASYVRITSSVIKDSIKLTRDPYTTDRYYINFAWDVESQNNEISIGFMGAESIGSSGYIIYEPEYIPTKINLPIGMVQSIPYNEVVLDTSNYTHEGLMSKTKECWPIVIEVKSPEASEFTFITLKNLAEEYLINSKSQKIVVQGYVFDIYDVPGSGTQQSSSDENIDCMIWMAQPKSTIFMPCLHMWLCKACADVVRALAEKRCPMCRETVNDIVGLVNEA